MVNYLSCIEGGLKDIHYIAQNDALFSILLLYPLINTVISTAIIKKSL